MAFPVDGVSLPLSPTVVVAVHALQIRCRVDGAVDDVLCSTPSIVPSLLLSLLELPLIDRSCF